MVDKKTEDKPEDKKEKDPFADSSEIFESIFKEATQEIQKETGKPVAQPGLKPKPKPQVKPKPAVKPKAPVKLELEAKEEPKPKAEPPQEKPRPEQKPRLQPPAFKARQEPIRKPITRAPTPDEEETPASLLSTHRLTRSELKKQDKREEPGGKLIPKLPKKKGKGSPLLKIILLLLLLAVGVGGASVYFGIIDLSEYIGGAELAKKEAPKAASVNPSPAQQPAKTPQPAAPKAATSSAPQAKPAEAQKPAVQPPAVQPSQAPPKPAQSVTPPPAKEVQPPPAKPETPVEPAKAASPPAPPPAPPVVSPPQPPGVQAKAEPPSPPAVAKVETPLPVQPPAKVEPPPAPPQPPVASPPQSPPPSAQPAVKSESKAPPAPVQQPPVPKKVETPQPSSQPKEMAAAKTVPPVSGSGTGYPYSVYLGSVQGMDYVRRAMSSYESQGVSTYWSKVDLGAKGTWYRLFTGYFRSAQEAEGFIQQKKIKDGEVKETRYANLIGTFGSKQGGEEKALALAKMGLSAYWIPAAEGQVRLFSGAFMTKDGAEKNQAELNSKGIKSEIVER